MAQFVDWDLAAATAGVLGKSGPPATAEEAAEAVAELRTLAELAAGHVAAYTLMAPPATDPLARAAAVRVVDRRAWAEANIDGLRQVVTPLLDRAAGSHRISSMMDAVGSRVAGVQAGTVLAYLSGRVLGQYEVFSANPGQLLLVVPNIVEVERRLNVVPRHFRLWVCLHEVTHRVQFTAVPWLREHFLGEVAAFVDAGGTTEQMAERVRQALATAADVIRNPNGRSSILDLVQTPAQRVVLDRITALMTLLEGHAEFVMDGMGPDVVPTVATIRAVFNRRREGANPVERLVRRVLGVDAKLRQYAEGRRFVHESVTRIGMAGFNTVWDSPATLPTLAELSDVPRWIDRVIAPPGITSPDRGRT